MRDLFKVFTDKSALLLILVGALLFGGSIPLPKDGPIDLPYLETAVQLCGGMLLICGFAIIASRIFWPEVSTRALIKQVENGNAAAGAALLGLKLFNGLSLIAFALFLALMFGAKLGHG